MSTSNFGERLKQLRREKNLTQEQLAELFGIARNSLLSYETGRRVPDIEVLKSYAEYFGVTSDYLLGISDNRTPETAAVGNSLGLSDESLEKLRFYEKYNSALALFLEGFDGEEERKLTEELIESGVYGHSYEEVFNNLCNIQTVIGLIINSSELTMMLGRYLFENNYFMPESPETPTDCETGEEIPVNDSKVRKYYESIEMTQAVNMYRLHKKLAELREFCAENETIAAKIRIINEKSDKYYYSHLKIGNKHSSFTEDTNAKENKRKE